VKCLAVAVATELTLLKRGGKQQMENEVTAHTRLAPRDADEGGENNRHTCAISSALTFLPETLSTGHEAWRVRDCQGVLNEVYTCARLKSARRHVCGFPQVAFETQGNVAVTEVILALDIATHPSASAWRQIDSPARFTGHMGREAANGAGNDVALLDSKGRSSGPLSTSLSPPNGMST